MSIENRGKQLGGSIDNGTYTRTRHRYGSYWRGRTDVVTITPNNLNTDAPRYILAPGYSANGNPTTSEEIAARLALSTGATVDVFTVSGFLRGRKLSKQAKKEFPLEPTKNNVRKTGRSTLEINRAASLLHNLKKRGIRTVRIVAHSLGIQPAAFAMSLDHEGIIKDGAGVASGGVNEKRPIKNIITRFGTDSIKEAWRARKNKTTKSSMRNLFKAGFTMLLKHPIRSAWHEIRAAKYGNVARTIIDAKAKLRFLTGTTDAVFGPHAFSTDLNRIQEQVIYDGGHNLIYTDPTFVKEKVVPLFAA
ncbi:MAG TPA: hypothetical protein VND99_02185 [Candidatus Acidoferrales bacterium]|nr:hypothetical protein [Candidatus Acidoferrales bacterium]